MTNHNHRPGEALLLLALIAAIVLTVFTVRAMERAAHRTGALGGVTAQFAGEGR